jgi:hypothetical protein
MPATFASAMATHGSLQVRELRRHMAAIISSSNKGLEALAAAGGSRTTPQTLASEVSLMATQLAALHYPPRLQPAALAMVAKSQSLAASLRSGQTNAGNALFAAVTAAAVLRRHRSTLSVHHELQLAHRDGRSQAASVGDVQRKDVRPSAV